MGSRVSAGASSCLGAILGCRPDAEGPTARGLGLRWAARTGLVALLASIFVIAGSALQGTPPPAAKDVLSLSSFSAEKLDASVDSQTGAQNAGLLTDPVASTLGRVFFAADARGGIPGGGGVAHLSLTDDHGDEPSTSSEISTGFPVTGQIGTANDADYFRLVLGQPTLVSIYTIGDLDTVGRLIDINGREVAANDDGGKLSNFRIEANLAQGIHYVQIRASGNATGDYQLHANAQTHAPAEFTNSIGMNFALVPSGEFDMGSVSGEADEWPLTQVEISRAFYMGKHEVTHGQWLAVMGSVVSDENFSCGVDCPVVGVSWEDAQEFARRLNAMEGTTRYRLPTEAEWEYAARAGTTKDRYSSDLDLIAWYESNSVDRLGPVGRKRANAFGLHDMLGNVWEWVEDWYGPYSGGSATDPTGPSEGAGRVLRGGSHQDYADSIRASQRGAVSPDTSYSAWGFRLAISPKLQTGSGSPGTDDHGDEPSQATPLAIGTSATGRIGPDGDVDYFSLELSERTAVAIYTTGSLDTLGSLRDAANQKVAGDDDSGGGANFRIDATLPAGIHYVRVESYQGAEGRYTLHVDRRAVETPPAGELTNTIGMEFALVPAGEFEMGSKSGNVTQRPVTRVLISRAFYLGKHEVTQGQWEAVMASNPSRFSACGADCPVELVSWEDAQEFVRSLNEKEDMTRYRLPTEAEWEYSARAGTTGERYLADVDAIAWHEGNSGESTHPVGEKRANSFGLYDMLGNVWEWVQDWYGDYPGGTVTDPLGPPSGSQRVGRGGSFSRPATESTASARARGAPSSRFFNQGLRLAISTDLGAGIGAPSTDDHGNEPSLASPLAIGTPVPGQIEQGEDADYFRLEFGEKTHVAIYTAGSLATTGSLRDASNAELATDSASGATNFRIEATLEAGVYYVSVESQGDATGGYTLHVERRTVFTNSIGMELELLPAGEFVMGSESSEADPDEQPVRRVQISQPFFLGKYEVTQEQWEAVMGSNPSRNSGCDRQCPVEWVTWEDAQEFVRALNEKEGVTMYRLPTEAEWEYAARAGTTAERYLDNLDDIAWCRDNSAGRTHPVGEKRGNAFGLHDMLGNVWEWVEDGYGLYPDGPAQDPIAGSTAWGRVRRGGSWYSTAESCRSANRWRSEPSFRSSNLGFRLAMTPLFGTSPQTRLEDDYPNTPSQVTTTLALGSSAEGQIGYISDHDYFRLELTETTDLTIYTTGSLNTRGILLDQESNRLASDDDRGEDSNFRIEATLEQGTYFVGVSTVTIQSGYYTLHAEQQPTAAFTSPSTGMEFELVPAGVFNMGSESDVAHWNESPVTQVRISQPFYIGRYEVTQGQWRSVTGSTPSYFSECGDDCPVERVSWDDAQNFVRTLNEREGVTLYRLPTEAEWEYAARAGTTEERHSDNLRDIAWCGDHGGEGTHPVGQLLPNAFGLHDVLGNVQEWVEDLEWGKYAGGAVTDPFGPSVNWDGRRVLRGGTWNSAPDHCRSAARYGAWPHSDSYRTGVRIVRSLGAEPPQRYILDDHGNQRSEALEFDFGDTFGSGDSRSRVGEIAPGSDVDYFKFNLERSALMEIYTTGSLSTRGGLSEERETGGYHYLATDQGSGDGDNFKIEVFLEPGSYYVEVRSDGNDTGIYNLVWEYEWADREKEKLGDITLETRETLGPGTFGTPTQLEFGVVASGNIPDEDDVDHPDYYRLPDVEDKTRVAIYLSKTGNAKLTVQGPVFDDRSLFLDENFPVVIDLESSEDRYLHLSGTQGDYTLLIDKVRLVREEATWEDPITMEFVRIPSTDEFRSKYDSNYKFLLGSEPPGTDPDESPVNERGIDSFWMGKYEVTKCQWSLLMPHDDFDNDVCEREEGWEPVVNVSWRDAMEFIAELNKQLEPEEDYRLPTEAEWEYAARAGTSGARYGDVDEIAWHAGNSWNSANPPARALNMVGLLQANAFGLHDMLGNAWEWSNDRYESYRGAVLGGLDRITGVAGHITAGLAEDALAQYYPRTLRGGGFRHPPTESRASNRDQGQPGHTAKYRPKPNPDWKAVVSQFDKRNWRRLYTTKKTWLINVGIKSTLRSSAINLALWGLRYAPGYLEEPTVEPDIGFRLAMDRKE